jgi:hypothetical protein
MVDSIVLRIHNLKKYDLLIQILHLEKNRGFRIKTVSVDQKEFDRLKSLGFGMRYTLDVMEHNRTGEFLAKTEFSKRYNTSGHYAFVYNINYSRDFIEFNFSIPKYKFGSNVIMDIEHYWDIHFKYNESTTLDYQVIYVVNNLIRFIKVFLAKEFIGCNISSQDVEVNRIDFCFNQIFPTKDDAMRYLNFQKKLHKKYARENGGAYNYDTTIMYTSNRSSFKIYHKGAEYKKKDFRQHIKINTEKQFEYFKTAQIQCLADRMLRYEMTFRSSGLNYIFKNNIFRKNCSIFKAEYKTYLKVDAIKQRNDSIEKKIGEISDEQEKAAFKKYHPYEKITKDDLNAHKYISSLLNSNPKFMLHITDDADRYNRVTQPGKCDTALFSEELVQLCIHRLIKEVKEFQISELPDIERLELLIDQYNARTKKKMMKSELIRFYEMWKKHGSFKEAVRICGFSRATIFRYKMRFKRLNITEKQFSPDNISLISPEINFKEYQSIITMTPIMKGIRIFKL